MTGCLCGVPLPDNPMWWNREQGSDVSLWEAVLIALRGLRAHRLRSALTMLGLIIGVSAVILLVAICSRLWPTGG